jgi:heme exporter protein CcmD
MDFEFDKNAAFIWSAYAIGALLILGAVIHTVLAARAAKEKLERIEKDEP